MAVSKEWAFTRSFLRKVYNPQVLEYFRDLEDDDLDSINVPRKAARRACLVLPNEAQISALQKQFNFWYLCQQIQNRPDIIGGKPKDQLDDEYVYSPHVVLFFKQDLDAVPDGFSPVEGEISFRLINETAQSLSEAKLKTLAAAIKQEFALNGGYLWKKGKNLYSYRDRGHGLDLLVLSISQSEGVEVIQKICSVVNATYESDRLVPHEPVKASVNNPGSQTILGSSYKKRRWRPTAQVRFRSAKMAIHGVPRHKYLVDLTGKNESVIY